MSNRKEIVRIYDGGKIVAEKVYQGDTLVYVYDTIRKIMVFPENKEVS